MKKIILLLCGIAPMFSANADENCDAKKVEFYGGVSLNGSSSSSEYKMDFETDQGNLAGAGGTVRHKKNNINRLGYGLFLGLGGGSDHYYALEAGVGFGHFKSGKTFNDHEALEFPTDPAVAAGGGRTGAQCASLKIACGNEYFSSLKFGKNLGNTRVYGILGVATRKVQVEYTYFLDHPEIVVGGAEAIYAKYSHKFEKRIWALVPGIGTEYKLHNNCSIGLEYKYKFYQSADSSKDLTNVPPAGAMDTKPRNYKTKTRQHDLSLRFIINL